MEKFKLGIGVETKDLSNTVEVLTTMNDPNCRITITKIDILENAVITADCFIYGKAKTIDPEFLKDLTMVSDETMVITLEGEIGQIKKTVYVTIENGIMHVLNVFDAGNMKWTKFLYLYVPAFGMYMSFGKDKIILTKHHVDVFYSPVVRHLDHVLSASFEDIKSSLAEVSKVDSLWKSRKPRI